MAVTPPDVAPKKVSPLKFPEAIRAELMERLRSGDDTDGTNTKNLMEIGHDQVHKILGLYNNYIIQVGNLGTNAAAMRDEANADKYRKLEEEIEEQCRRFFNMQVSVMRLRASNDAWLQANISNRGQSVQESLFAKSAERVPREELSMDDISDGEESSDEELLSDSQGLPERQTTLAQLRSTLSENLQKVRTAFSECVSSEGADITVGFTKWTNWEESLQSLDALENSSFSAADDTSMFQRYANLRLLQSLRKKEMRGRRSDNCQGP
ncbi:hypothetical protein QFC22_006666 [Naganishia vaughanmartiniae]|uniref:Uncharacterized protein n=1 Tax=Naganishia vaughanmartiniae TaxID=1424756 RepID=A0ACC2WHI7_9TREE|nr:hypothetical protein QFC22_006666 [Naganishia vaughanmartiniae]